MWNFGTTHLGTVETCLSISHTAPSLLSAMQASTFQTSSFFFPSKPCQHWGNRTGKSHHSTEIVKYQNLFHLVKILSMPNKTNTDLVNYARLWVVLLFKRTLGSFQSITQLHGLLLLLCLFRTPSLKCGTEKRGAGSQNELISMYLCMSPTLILSPQAFPHAMLL